jgi:hypothetical protein
MASVVAIFMVSKIPSVVKNSFIPIKKDNAYGNHAYGGNKKNA